MVFENEGGLRIGPTGAQKDLFKMPGKGGKLRNGKRFEIPEYLAGLGLNAYEFPGGRMANFSDNATYAKFRKNSDIHGIAISFHAPYYISLTSENPEIYEKSIERVAHSYAWATYLNAKRIVVHPGTYGSQKKKGGMDKFMSTGHTSHTSHTSPVKKKMSQIITGIQDGIKMASDLYPDLRSQFKNICLCPETMGKHGQMGTLKEIIEICKSVGLQKTRPCIDFGHIFARNLGKKTGSSLYGSVFDKLESELGNHVVQHLHIHYSVIEYTEKGEKKHHGNQNSDWGPSITPLFDLIEERSLTPIIINESPELEPDAVLLMNQWKQRQQRQ
ncbi:MAG: TIM barrel protein [Promethearchaeota archaeon]